VSFYWDVEMQPWFERVAALSARQRLAVALGVVERTLAGFDPPFAALVDDGTCRLVDRVLAGLRSAVTAGRTVPDVEDPEAVAVEIVDAVEGVPAPEVDSLLMALLNLVGPDELSARTLYLVLDGLYRTALTNAEVPVWSEAAEVGWGPCRAAVAVQQQLIAAVASA
jgi:hypothetical protein